MVVTLGKLFTHAASSIGTSHGEANHLIIIGYPTIPPNTLSHKASSLDSCQNAPKTADLNVVLKKFWVFLALPCIRVSNL